MNRIVILTGAGSAIPWDGPKSKFLTDKIILDNTFNAKDGKTLGKWIYDKMIEFYNKNPDSINFETILNAISTLDSYFKSKYSNGLSQYRNNLPIFFSEENLDELIDFDTLYEIQNGMYKAENPTVNSYSFWKTVDYFFENVYTLYCNIIISEIEKYEKNYINKIKLNDDLKDFHLYLKGLKGDSVIRNYTLNYDSLFTKIIPNTFNGYTDGYVDAKKIIYDNDVDCVYNLHGNTHYFIDKLVPKFDVNKYEYNFGRGMSNGHTQQGNSLIKSNIITGLNKPDQIIEEPYLRFYQKFYEDCYNADYIFLIGYSGGDLHINKSIENSWVVDNNRKIIIVDYDETLSTIEGKYTPNADYSFYRF